MEDVLQQETREKIESFALLGYYFIVFRALDESYFRYTSPSVSLEDSNLAALNKSARETGGVPTAATTTVAGDDLPQPRAKVEIVEGVGGKEGVEGVGAGAINLYLVVFADGVLSFHFEDISKHIDRVQGNMRQFGLSRSITSHWIAYTLMDSVVDSFFPILSFIEQESKDVDVFMSDPLDSMNRPKHVNREIDDAEVKGIIIEDLNEGDAGQQAFKRATVLRETQAWTLRFVPRLRVPGVVLRIFPDFVFKPSKITTKSTVLLDAMGARVTSDDSSSDSSSFSDFDIRHDESAPRAINDASFDRATLLRRITDMRRLVTGLTRLLGPKLDVVRGLRKRSTDEHFRMARNAASMQEMSIYLSDLLGASPHGVELECVKLTKVAADHIVAMQQNLMFYDVVLSHDHPAYLSLLGITLRSAKAGQDRAIIRLSIVGVTFLSVNIFTLLFGTNVMVPHSGDRATHRYPDGRPASYLAFGLCILGVVIMASSVLSIVYWIMRSSKHAAKRRRSPL